MSKLADYLASGRKRAKLSLRAAQDATGISNAYLSQLETGKIQEPSPILLEKLASTYQLDYATLLKLAGYPLPESQRQLASRLEARLGPTTNEEEEELIHYLDFLRMKRKTGGAR
jgi:transcriptional regulator with XRE-family HTH domain